MFRFRLVYITAIAFFCSSNLYSFGADLRNNPEARYNSVQEYFNRHTLLSPQVRSPNLSPISKSDLGIQRPVETKKKGFGYHFGFESRLLYSNNPSSSTTRPFKASGIWENSMNNNFLLGAYDLGGASFSPILALGVNNSSYFGDEDLGVADSSTLRLSFNGIFQFSDGWSARMGVGHSSDFHSNMTLTYQQNSPSVSLSKSFKIGSASSFIDVSCSYHLTSKAQLDMDRFENAILWGLQIPIHNFEISPYLRLSYGNYINQDRNEFTTGAGLDLSYRFYDWLVAKFLLSYSNRSANGSSNDFSRFDSGSALTLQSKF